MFKTQHRLAKNSEVKQALSRGRNFFNPNFTLKVLISKEISAPRFAIIVSTKVSKLAVKRNRLKRLVREWVKTKLTGLPMADYVIIAKPAALRLQPLELQRQLLVLFNQISK